MTQQPLSVRLAALFALALSASGSAQTPTAPNNLDLATGPLEIAASVDPNVMLLIDNSGSMNQLLWHKDFDSSKSYSSWQYCSKVKKNSCNDWSDLTDSSYFNGTGSFKQAGCATGAWAFRKSSGSSTICLKLPDPAANEGGTRYERRYLRFLLDTYATAAAFEAAVSSGAVPSEHRMKVAREVAQNLVKNTVGVRFGYSVFNAPISGDSGDSGDRGPGGRIAANCSTRTSDDTSALVTAIGGILAETNTPLAETMYEITRYFRGLSSYYNSGTLTSPIQYRCQKNFTVVITDGLPTYDRSFPDDDPDKGTGSLPNWDDKAPATNESDAPNFPQYSDGFNTSDDGEGATLYLDDIAKFAYDIDMRKTDNDNAGKSFDDPDFKQQNLRTYTVGFTLKNQMLQDAAEYGHGRYFTADNADELSNALEMAMRDIRQQAGSFARTSASSGSASSSTMLYQASFDSEGWQGHLNAYTLALNDDGQSLRRVHQWDAATKIPAHGSRVILTRNDTTGTAFAYDNLSAAQRAALAATEAEQKNIIDYLRGDDSKESNPYRTRPSRLGDIINSAPQYIGPPAERYTDAAYVTFRSNKKDRAGMVYVGANDGMLHAFDGASGDEKMAYIPSMLIGRLNQLAQDTDTHQYYVDGTPTIADAKIGTVWKTMLVGGLNAGGQGIYALDVSDPASFSADNAASIVQWEFTDNGAEVGGKKFGDPDLGYTFSRPVIAKLRGNRWVVIFGNGYNNTVADGRASTTGNAVLYVVNLADGSLLYKLDTGKGYAADPSSGKRPNGLASPAVVDSDGDGLVDVVYAGDLYGNLWKFDFTATTPTIALSGQPLFSAPCTGLPDACQSITSKPSVSRHPQRDGLLVHFGTGKNLERNDRNRGGQQSFYTIWDKGATVARKDLLQQKITGAGTHGFDVISTANTPDWSSQRGWYINLIVGNDHGHERQISDSRLQYDILWFTSTLYYPTATDPCVPSGRSRQFALNPATGAPIDGLFDGFPACTGSTCAPPADLATALIMGDKFGGSGNTSPGGQHIWIEKPGGSGGDGKDFGRATVTLREGRQTWRQLGR